MNEEPGGLTWSFNSWIWVYERLFRISLDSQCSPELVGSSMISETVLFLTNQTW